MKLHCSLLIVCTALTACAPMEVPATPINEPPTVTAASFATSTTEPPTPTPIPTIIYPTPSAETTSTGKIVLPEGVKDVLVYLSFGGQYHPVIGPYYFCFAVPLTPDGQSLGNGQFWQQVNFTPVLSPSPNRHLLAFADNGANAIDPFSGDPMFSHWNGFNNPEDSLYFWGWAQDNSGLLQTNSKGIYFFGSERKTLLQMPEGFDGKIDAALSPDGTQLLYSYYDRALDASPTTQQGETHLLNLTTGYDLLVLDIFISNPSWSPDGQWIAYKQSGRLGLMAPDGGNQQWITEEMSIMIRNISWSPTSDGLVFTRWVQKSTIKPESDFEEQISTEATYIVDIDDTGVHSLRPLWNNPLQGSLYPSWSPDGRSVLVVAGTAQSADIWLVSRHGGQQQLTFDGLEKRYPVWLQTP